jgi:hypothetical protein
MARNAVTEWDVTPSNNGDVAGINIAEGCPAGGINDAIRSIMAQFAGWLTSATGPLLKSGGAVTGAFTGLGNSSSVLDGGGVARGIGYRNIPLMTKSSTYTIALSDVGQGVSTNASVTVPANATAPFSIGDIVALYANSAGSITVTPASGVTLRLAGSSNSGARSLATRGLGTLIKVGTDEWVMSGMGLS